MLAQLRLMGFWDIVRTVLDISIVAYVLYRLLILIRGTRAVQLIKGVTVLFIAWWASDLLKLGAVSFLLDKAQVALVVALPIVFQPELRRALEQLGRGGFLVRTQPFGEEDLDRVLKDVVRAVSILSKNKTGALIVLERESGLKEVAETGTAIDGKISAELLINIFMPHTPLEDGAVLIRSDRIIAAGCFLPLSENPDLSRELGARHRAAIGLTEESDALVVVVSEESGAISLANAGKLIRNLDEETLNEMLSAMTNRPVTVLPWLRGTES
jgi:diadenylate cyclase